MKKLTIEVISWWAGNDGFRVLGNARSYKRGAVYDLVWNGSSLEE